MNKTLIIILIAAGIVLALVSSIVLAVVIHKSFQEVPVVFKKPAVYLYPIEDSFINVQLDVNGKIIKDIPPYNNGWHVFATQEGLIENKYDYLFYEAKLNQIDLPESGWIVPSQELENWFDTNLIKLGLNQKEKDQFKEYWLSELPDANYYEIKLFEENFLKENMNLIITPNPDTIIRLNFYFKPLKEKISLPEPIVNTPERSGFTVVEWGGILSE